MDILTKKRACLRCLKIGHQAKKCRGRLKCIVCTELSVNKELVEQSKPVETVEIENVTSEQAITNNTGGYVFLETLRVKVVSQTRSQEVEAEAAQRLGHISKRTERITHCLFGGTEQEQRHDCFDIQQTWEQQLSWDASVDADMEHVFRSWVRELLYLFDIEMPRWIGFDPEDNLEKLSLHVFCDASNKSYAAVVFLRKERHNEVSIHLMATKARVASLKKMTMSRLELRLCKSVEDDITHKAEAVLWSDSSTVISWICRKDDWSPFVGNRLLEIRSLTPSESWRHAPGNLNPADLPSRGCSAKHLFESRWWEGPSWLRQPSSQWARQHFECDEEEIGKEKRKKPVVCLLNSNLDEWHMTYFSSYTKTLRMVGWISRFIYNVRNPIERQQGPLTTEEISLAETFVFKLVQQEVFHDECDKRISTLNLFKNSHGVIRLKSSVSNRENCDNFRFPVVLPGRHTVVNRLVFEQHQKSCYVGTQGLMSILREKYWVIGGRRAIRSVIAKCVFCKRHSAKPPVVTSPALPLDRVRDPVAFEITGIDFAGPLYLKTEKKAWVCLFTLTTSLSTASFMQAFRRFVARRGRPKVIYSDNGTNFAGT
ncbi:hypothetical protein NQ318_010621 [Aromia moschata]|uniref:Uncharacterized protein n=1 Tax=Aromia moschata TaxID=1265417 RepID=A0AAV8XKE8_9CUCU|nr:hypothetical protein NQ318_010621 [Aromia moschata]